MFPPGNPGKKPWKPLEIEFFPWKKNGKLPLEPLEIDPIKVMGTLKMKGTYNEEKGIVV